MGGGDESAAAAGADDLGLKVEKAYAMAERAAAEALMEASRAVEEEGEECAGLEPFFFDEAEAVADHERRMRRQQEKDLRKKRREARLAALVRILEYDPKLRRIGYTRIYFVDLSTFDLDEESPLGPMRDTDPSIDVLHGTVCKEGRKQFVLGDDSSNALSVKVASSGVDLRQFVPCNSANVLNVKIVSSDVGFPINVYGTVIAGDSLDLKCIYLFRCDRDNCQLILSKDESLIMTGPKRGLALIQAIYFEIDLKIKGDGKQKDEQLSKGYLTLDGIPRSFQDKMVVERYSLDSMLSKVVVTCAVEMRAVEATIAIEVVKGNFYGEITACTTSIRDSIVLHDSKVTADWIGKGVIQLSRRIVAVCLKEKLIVTIAQSEGSIMLGLLCRNHETCLE